VKKIARPVICTICSTQFDRDKIAFVQVSSRRYAHADCMLRRAASLNKEIDFQVIDPTDEVVCKYCKKRFRKTEEEYIQITNSQYAHAACVELESKREKTDAEKLVEYVMKLFGYEYVPPRAKKQINDYIREYNYTHSGMLKALIYYYEIRGGDVDKAHDGIGILPYIYAEARDYYFNLWQAQQKNQYKDIKQYIPTTIEVHITPPQRQALKRQRFGFLDEEEEHVE
jgi:hypothetical protein